jgi:hypothetical protein
MFTWICPKCGSEVPPSYSECPNCTAVQSAGQSRSSVDQPQQPAAETPAPPPPVRAEAAPPQRPPAPRPEPRGRSHVAVPAWVFVILLAVALGGIGFGLITWQQGRNAAPAAAAVDPLEKPAGPITGAQANPDFRDIELTGLRLEEDTKQKPFVHFVVVNHSAADVGEVAGTVHLRAVTKQDSEPIGTFKFKTKLGPYESADLKEPLSTKLRVYELPDWQFLKAEIASK